METQWIEGLSKQAVIGLDDDALLERVEDLFGICSTTEPAHKRMNYLRSQLDMVTREGERRKLICWILK
jgi:hypothetical protein